MRHVCTQARRARAAAPDRPSVPMPRPAAAGGHIGALRRHRRRRTYARRYSKKKPRPARALRSVRSAGAHVCAHGYAARPCARPRGVSTRRRGEPCRVADRRRARPRRLRRSNRRRRSLFFFKLFLCLSWCFFLLASAPVGGMPGRAGHSLLSTASLPKRRHFFFWFVVELLRCVD